MNLQSKIYQHTFYNSTKFFLSKVIRKNHKYPIRGFEIILVSFLAFFILSQKESQIYFFSLISQNKKGIVQFWTIPFSVNIYFLFFVEMEFHSTVCSVFC